MVKEKVKVNVQLTINEYDKFTFKETQGRVEKEEKKKSYSAPYAFPLSTSPNQCLYELESA